MPEQTTPMREQDNIDRLRLARAEGVGPVTYRRLLTRFDTAAAALRSLPRLARAGGKANPPVVPTEADAIRELDRAAKLGARLLFLGDADYPTLLARLDDAPPVIAVQGDAALLALRAVALVGGRNASVNGRRIAEDLGASGHDLVILTRRPNPRLKVRQVVWDGDSVGDWACELEGPDTALINLAGKLVDCRRRPAPVFSSRPDAP